MDNIRMDVMKLTPSDARSIIDSHKNFRSLSNSTVNTYTRLMNEGKWNLSIILIDTDGMLVDGQHRLAAVVKSGKDQRFVVISNWPKDNVLTLDNGSNRTRSQSLKYSTPEMKHTNKKAAIAVGIENITKDERITNTEAVDLYNKYHDVVDQLIDIQADPFRGAIHAIAFARAIVYLPWTRSDVVEAFRKMCDYDFSEPRMSGLKLYARLVSQSSVSSGGASVRKELYLRCANALHSYLHNRELNQLRIPANDPFPVEVV